MGGGVLLPNIIGYYIYLYFIFYFNFLLHILNPSFFPHHLNLHNRPDDDCVAGDEEVLLEGVDAEMEAEEIGHRDLSVGVVCQNYEEPGQGTTKTTTKTQQSKNS